MYDEWGINELLEKSFSAMPDEAAEMMLEVSRRYREGIGVPADSNEAERWASDAERLLGKIDAHSGSGKTATLAKQGYSKEECKAMSDHELFHAYREGDPWAIYYFSLKLIGNGEQAHALSELEELSCTLENEIESDEQNKESSWLIVHVKTLIASIYEDMGETSENLEKAMKNYSDAYDLGFQEAIPGLLRCYRKDGYKKHEKDILQLLRHLEDGDTEDKIIAVEAYQELGHKTYASILKEELLFQATREDNDNVTLLLSLKKWGSITNEALESRSANGDGVASWALGIGYHVDGCFEKAEKYYKKAITQGQTNAEDDYNELKMVLEAERLIQKSNERDEKIYEENWRRIRENGRATQLSSKKKIMSEERAKANGVFYVASYVCWGMVFPWFINHFGNLEGDGFAALVIFIVFIFVYVFLFVSPWRKKKKIVRELKKEIESLEDNKEENQIEIPDSPLIEPSRTDEEIEKIRSLRKPDIEKCMATCNLKWYWIGRFVGKITLKEVINQKIYSCTALLITNAEGDRITDIKTFDGKYHLKNETYYEDFVLKHRDKRGNQKCMKNGISIG